VDAIADVLGVSKQLGAAYAPQPDGIGGTYAATIPTNHTSNDNIAAPD
jgi:hypothetical protein